MPDTLSLRPSSVLAAFLEQVAEGRRVIVFGDATSALAEQLLERGARLVHVCDPDTSRVAAAAARSTSQSVSYAPLTPVGLSVREGAFDLGIVENLGALSEMGAELVLRQLSRALTSAGVVAVSSPNPAVATRLVGRVQEAHRIDYYQLFDLVSGQFDGVCMYGQMPFLGYSIAAFGAEGELEPSLDTAYLPGGSEEPEWYLAVAGSRINMLEPFRIVQLPAEVLARGDRAELLRDLQRARASENTAIERLAELDAACATLREKARVQQPEPQWSKRLADLSQLVEQRDAWIAQLEARSVTADARADDVEGELEQVEGELEQARGELSKLKNAAQASDARASDARAELERVKGELARVKGAAAAAALASEAAVGRGTSERDAPSQKLVEELRTAAETARSQIASLEAAVAVAESSTRKLEAELESSGARCRALEAAIADERNRVGKLEATRAVSESRGEALESRLKEIEQQLRAAQAEAAKADEDPEELSALERQLVERGHHVRQLERDIKESERFGQELLFEMEQLRLALQNPGSPDGWSVPQDDQVASEWAATTRQDSADSEPWAEAQLNGPSSGTVADGVAGSAGHAAMSPSGLGPDREAELVAELQMARWAVDKLQAELQSAKLGASGRHGLELELERARVEIQRQAVLIEQLRQA